MSDALSDYMENEIRDAMFRATDIVARSTLDSTSVSAGDKCYADEVNGDGNVYVCTTAGTTGASAPSFNTTLGATTTDSGATWTACQPGVLKQPLEIALFGTSASLSNLEAGTLTGEFSGNGYARVSLDPSDTNWDAPSAGEADNASDITFATATGNWSSDVRYAAVLGLNDEVIWAGQLQSDKTINNGQAFKFNAGDFVTRIT